ncbi:MIP/aquaporin family protein [Virgibacillus salexigens]|uniref:Glycerol uptake facilitator protein n=1 Tax=Virgibacillus massiliensis TaxID=1462526 RepID=A0A024QAU9_9BACI|nr:MIP/aquaporin family protein [Virgibacillus massiliensis]MYL40187.1 MIP family channel protein [Virgibacillus massiliensis]CDQ39046.1 Glycerol uptake facilitator protein [Virgibacillus massiliensis]
MSEFIGELIGTMILIIFGGGVVAGVNLKKTLSEGSGWVLISFAWGLGVAMGVYAVGSITGAHLNPAVTLGFASIGEFPWAKVPIYICAQMLGGMIGAVIVFFHYLPHWKETNDPAVKLGVFSTGPAIPSTMANLISEMIGTFVLVMGLLFIGANTFTEGLNPLIVGLLIVVIGMSLGGTTGYAINPARDLGPRIAHWFLPIPGKGHSNWSYAWIPVIGPALGGIYGGLFYEAIFKTNGTIIFWVFSIGILLLFATALLQELKKAS